MTSPSRTRRVLIPCQADDNCYRTDGHSGDHAYADGRTPGSPTAVPDPRHDLLLVLKAEVEGLPRYSADAQFPDGEQIDRAAVLSLLDRHLEQG